MKKIILFLLFSFLFVSEVLAEESRLAPKTTPLPYEQVDVIFKKMRGGEIIPVETLHQALLGPQFALRAGAARMLGEFGKKESIPFLIDALSDESSHFGANYKDPGMETTRYWANQSLIRLTGKNFGFAWNAKPEKRKIAISNWVSWYKQNYKSK